ncbi:Aste57867_6249 [Aphanomyces stellatus]|uniref:Aste57867_6249 protein n=1 Tax=Aphanomyces stellatus TaxID=120398 RepID=A0A485KGD1_9STRA|nr:hypothetical protein As57867_006235 [Aphanomyces stellatus]VFT83248.1 Aste57867_6249 [Aphanomyces stellatus]
MKLTYTLTTAIFAASAYAQLEIVGGKEAAKGQHQYVTGLRKTAGGSDFCGGSLIAPNVVLTAAHCIPAKPQYVAIGTHYLSGTQDGEQIKVTKTVVHPKRGNNNWDFAVLILERDSKFAPVQVSFDEVKAGTPTIVRGWGTTSSGGSQSNVLLEVGVDAIDNAQCGKFLGSSSIDETMLCAGGKRGEDSCQGDSGGPLTVEQNGSAKLVGVVSWGDGCAQQDKPGVYARISIARDFIQPYLKGASPSPSSPTMAPSTKPTAGPATKKPSTSKPSKPSGAPATSPPSNQCNGCTGCYYPTLSHCFPSEFDHAICDTYDNLGAFWCGN